MRNLSPALRRVLGYALGLVIVLVGWHLTAVLVNSLALPTPAATVPMLAKYAAAMLPDFGVSFYRVVIAMAIGCVLALPVGLWTGRNAKVDAVLGPVFYLLYPIPKIVFLPVFLVLLGLADAPKIALIALTIFFQVVMTVRDAAKRVPHGAILSIRSLGANEFNEYRHVVIPAVLPDLFTALRISTGTAIAILFFAEAFAGSTGLGYFIMDSWAMIDYPRMFAGIIALALLGIVLYVLFDLAERRLMRWRR